MIISDYQYSMHDVIKIKINVFCVEIYFIYLEFILIYLVDLQYHARDAQLECASPFESSDSHSPSRMSVRGYLLALSRDGMRKYFRTFCYASSRPVRPAVEHKIDRRILRSAPRCWLLAKAVARCWIDEQLSVLTSQELHYTVFNNKLNK